MPDKIDLHAMEDHDLLIMAVMQGNECVRHLEIINSTVGKHERRLIDLETQPGSNRPINLTKKQAISLGSAMIIIGGFVAGIIERFLL